MQQKATVLTFTRSTFQHFNFVEPFTFKLHLTYYLFFCFFIYRNALQGMGETIFPLFACIAEFVMRSFAAVYLAIKFGYVGVFYSGPIAWISASAVVFVGYMASIRHIIFKVKEKSHNRPLA